MKSALQRSGLVLLALVTLSARPGAQADEEFARRQFESGRSFLDSKRYAEALKDFQGVADWFAKSSIADDALLQIALYQFDVARNTAAAQTAVDRLLKDYPVSDSAPMAYVLSGRLTLAKGPTPANVDAAFASFERVPRLFPGSDSVPAAGFYAGDTLRQAGRFDEALDHFRTVTMQYPRSIWAARGNLAAAACLVQADRASRAFQELEHVRLLFKGTPEAEQALNLSTIIYRLYLRAPAQPTHAFSGRYIGNETAKFRDVTGVVVDDTGRVLIGHKQGVAVFDAKGTLIKAIAADSPSTFFVDERSRVVLARREVLTADGAESTSLFVPQPGEQPRPVEEIPSLVVLSNGNRIVADRKGKSVIRVDATGKFLANFAAINAERIARDALDNVAIIDRDMKAVVVANRDGKQIARFPTRGTGYQFDSPADVAFDSLGNLYVLDRGKASILVFGPKNKLLTTIAFPDKGAAATKPEAMALDAAGRIYIFDDRSQRVHVYQ